MKRIKSNFYSVGVCKYKNCYSTEDKTLYSYGIYKTKLKRSDLPEWYIYGIYYKHYGYMSCKNINQLEFTGNKFTNHLFKDCFLRVTYNNKLSNSDEFETHRIWGNSIISFLIGCQKHGYDIESIKKDVDRHIIALKSRCDEDWVGAIGSFDDIMNISKYS